MKRVYLKKLWPSHILIKDNFCARRTKRRSNNSNIEHTRENPSDGERDDNFRVEAAILREYVRPAAGADVLRLLENIVSARECALSPRRADSLEKLLGRRRFRQRGGEKSLALVDERRIGVVVAGAVEKEGPFSLVGTADERLAAFVLQSGLAI